MKKIAQLLAAGAFVFALAFGTTYAQSASTEATPVKVEKVSAKAVATPAATQAKKAGCCSMKAASSTPACCASKGQSSAASCHGTSAKASKAAAMESKTSVAVSNKEEK